MNQSAQAPSLSSRHASQQVVVGIGGGSGSGKSTVAALLVEKLKPLSVGVINQDQFFRAPVDMPTYKSAFRGSANPDFNHPDSFDRDGLILVCRELTGYDVLIIEGILVLYFAEVRSLMHLKCYVTIELDEMLARRTERNLAAGYGGTREEIGWYNTECVTPQHARFNAPTKRYADFLIPNDAGQSIERDRIISDICVSIRKRWETSEPVNDF